jgi:hypothetical protein
VIFFAGCVLSGFLFHRWRRIFFAQEQRKWGARFLPRISAGFCGKAASFAAERRSNFLYASNTMVAK